MLEVSLILNPALALTSLFQYISSKEKEGK